MLSLLFSNPVIFVLYMLALLVAITIHEFAHAFSADRLGDPTPEIQGRLSLNPFVHIDPLGIAFLLFVGFGWGRPVEFDPFNLKNPRRDAAIISLAGPLSNFLLAILLSVIFSIFQFSFLVPFIYLNVILGVFNLLPIHPLDGFKIVGGFLSQEQARQWYQLERYGILFLLLLILPIGKASMLQSIVLPVVDFILNILIRGNMTGII